tara:strand:- start:116 stop:352 length:237 start_codon:yes stop_codon:yes gene_type:complete
MEFYEITEDRKTTPGEYIYHEPTRQIVLCGAFSRESDEIKVLARGRLFVDKISNFKKIQLTHEESAQRGVSSCKGCGK